jgi:hypothetical protein
LFDGVDVAAVVSRRGCSDTFAEENEEEKKQDEAAVEGFRVARDVACGGADISEGEAHGGPAAFRGLP